MAEEEKTAAEELQESEDALIEATQARLDAFNGDKADDDDDDDDQTENDGDDSEPTPDDDDDHADDDDDHSDDDDDQAGDDDDDDDDSTSEEDATEEKTEVDGLPEAYMRAAIHQGWDEKEVKEFFEAKPEVALKTFAKIHESTNKLSVEFARLGRVEPVKKTPEVAEKKTTETTEEDGTLAALKEEYGEDSIMVKAFESLQGKLTEATKVQEKVAPTPEPDSAVQATVDKFFTDPSLKSYVKFYGEGKEANKLTVEQMNNRWSMLEMADRIIAGSESQGREITPEAAMEMAHLSVSEKHRTEALRVELKSKVKKRAKGVTLKPAKGKKVVSEESDARKTEKQLEASVSSKLKNMF